jgi:hypothetical protein
MKSAPVSPCRVVLCTIALLLPSFVLAQVESTHWQDYKTANPGGTGDNALIPNFSTVGYQGGTTDPKAPAGWAVVNVTAYGANGADNNDDAAAIQAAIDANEGLNKVLFFPAGTYRINSATPPAGTWHDSPLKIRSGNIVLRGEGTSTVIYQINHGVSSNPTNLDSAPRMISVKDTASVGLENLRLLGGWKDYSESFSHHKNYIHDSGWSAVTFENVADGWIRNVIFESWNTALAFYGNTREVTVMNCTFTGKKGHYTTVAQTATNRILYANILEETGAYHPPSVQSYNNSPANKIVYFRGDYRLVNNTFPSGSIGGLLDAHTGPAGVTNVPYDTLVDDTDARGAPDGAGNAAAGDIRHQDGLVVWNLTNRNSSFTSHNFNGDYQKYETALIIGAHGTTVSWSGSGVTTPIVELNGNANVVASVSGVNYRSLYEAQMRFRNGSFPAWLGNLGGGERCLACKSDNKNLEAEGGADGNGDNVARNTGTGAANRWQVIPNGSYYRIRSQAGTNLYVSAAGPEGSIPNGRNVALWSWVDSDLQLWELIPDGSYYRIRNKADPTKFLSASGSDENVHLWAWANSDLQRWQVVAP